MSSRKRLVSAAAFALGVFGAAAIAEAVSSSTRRAEASLEVAREILARACASSDGKVSAVRAGLRLADSFERVAAAIEKAPRRDRGRLVLAQNLLVMDTPFARSRNDVVVFPWVEARRHLDLSDLVPAQRGLVSTAFEHAAEVGATRLVPERALSLADAESFRCALDRLLHRARDHVRRLAGDPALEPYFRKLAGHLDAIVQRARRGSIEIAAEGPRERPSPLSLAGVGELSNPAPKLESGGLAGGVPGTNQK